MQILYKHHGSFHNNTNCCKVSVRLGTELLTKEHFEQCIDTSINQVHTDCLLN